MSKGNKIHLYDDTLQEVLSAAKRLAYSLKKEDLNADNREDFFNNARALDTLREHLLCPTCCNQRLDDIVVNLCHGEEAHGPKTDYKKGDRVRILSLPNIKPAELGSKIPSLEFVVTIVCAEHNKDKNRFGHELLVENKENDFQFYVDFPNVRPA